MTNYKKEYIGKRAGMIQSFNKLGRNFLKWLKRNEISFDEEEACEFRVDLGLLGGEYIVIYLNPESGSVTISGYIVFDRVYDDYCNDHGVELKDITSRSLTADEKKEIGERYQRYVDEFVEAIGNDGIMQKIISYFKRSEVVVEIVVDPVDGKVATIYKSKGKKTADVVNRLAFLIDKIEITDARFKQDLLIGELARSICGQSPFFFFLKLNPSLACRYFFHHVHVQHGRVHALVVAYRRGSLAYLVVKVTVFRHDDAAQVSIAHFFHALVHFCSRCRERVLDLSYFLTEYFIDRAIESFLERGSFLDGLVDRFQLDSVFGDETPEHDDVILSPGI